MKHSELVRRAMTIIGRPLADYDHLGVMTIASVELNGELPNLEHFDAFFRAVRDHKEEITLSAYCSFCGYDEKDKTCKDCRYYCIHCQHCHAHTQNSRKLPEARACKDFVPDTRPKITESASAMGKKGGKSKSDRKVAAARLNIKKASDAQTDEVRNQRIQNASKSQANRNEAISLISLKCTITSSTDFTRALHSIYGRKMSWETIFADIREKRLIADQKTKRLVLKINRKRKESSICIV